MRFQTNSLEITLTSNAQAFSLDTLATWDAHDLYTLLLSSSVAFTFGLSAANTAPVAMHPWNDAFHPLEINASRGGYLFVGAGSGTVNLTISNC